MKLENKLPNKISIANLSKYKYIKKQFTENIEKVYKDYYLFLPNVIVINNHYYYQQGTHFILFSESTFKELNVKLTKVNFNENTTNKYAENEKYAKSKLKAISEVYDYLNNINSEIEK